MANLIESLIGGAVQRMDEKRLKVVLRPAPDRPRPLLELFIAMGSTASFQALRRSIDLKGVDPAVMTFAILGRWPTIEETVALDDPYEAWPHMMKMLQSDEFRRHFARRVMEAFPERRRLLFVRVPSSGGDQVMAALDAKHPVLATDLHTSHFNNPGRLAQTMGNILTRMNVSNALALVQPRMATFCGDPSSVDPVADTLAWHIPSPPCRPGDLLFTILRDPTERALTAINSACADMRKGSTPIPLAIQQAAGLKAADAADLTPEHWQAIGRAMLAQTIRKNPVCHALADGTAAAALLACRQTPMQLVPLDKFRIWGRTALDVIPPSAPEPPPPILSPEDLSPSDRVTLDEATREDQILFDRLAARLKITSLPSAPGHQI
jgi:hypothetical protein